MTEHSSILPDNNHTSSESRKPRTGLAEMEFDLLVWKFVEKDQSFLQSESGGHTERTNGAAGEKRSKPKPKSKPPKPKAMEPEIILSHPPISMIPNILE